MHVIEVKNAELTETITERAKELGITDGAIVSLIGGADSFTISTMPAADATADVITGYALPAELHGAGEIADGVVRIHATMAVRPPRVTLWCRRLPCLPPNPNPNPGDAIRVLNRAVPAGPGSPTSGSRPRRRRCRQRNSRTRPRRGPSPANRSPRIRPGTPQ